MFLGKGLLINKEVYQYEEEKIFSNAIDSNNITILSFQCFPSDYFWSVTSSFPDLVPKFQNKIKLMGSSELQQSYMVQRNSPGYVSLVQEWH